MPAPKCPDPEQLHQLISGQMSAQYEEQLSSHIEICLSCRIVLEDLAGGDWTGVWSPGESLAAESSPALEIAMNRLLDAEPQSDCRAGFERDTVALNFLSPPRIPKYLGRFGHFDVMDIIGHGGMGVVARAHDSKLSCIRALKFLLPHLQLSTDARRRFLREARNAAAVSHANVVTIHQADEWNEIPFIVMEYVAGVSLRERIDQGTQLTVEEILRIGMQIASGLAAAHAQGLVHRDIKPANILLENHVERVKIADFGLARVAVGDSQPLTGPGVLAGTPNYMSPEQVNGKPADHRSDLFSLGCVLYQMCTRTCPFEGDSITVVASRICSDYPQPVHERRSDIPRWMSNTIGRLLQKDPDKRNPSAESVAMELRRGLSSRQSKASSTEGLGKIAESAGSPDIAKAPLASHRSWKAAIVPGAALILFLVVFSLRGYVMPSADTRPTPAKRHLGSDQTGIGEPDSGISEFGESHLFAIPNTLPGNLPDGWSGSDQVAVVDSGGLRLLKASRKGQHTIQSPAITLQEDFFVQIDVFYDATSALGITLLKSDGAQECDCRFHTSGRAFWNVEMSPAEPKFKETLQGGPTRFRLERIHGVYSLYVDEALAMTSRVDEPVSIDTIRLTLEGTDFGIADLRMGTINRGPSPSRLETRLFTVDMNGTGVGQLPSGWQGSKTVSVDRVSGASALLAHAKGRQRIRTAGLSITGDFLIDLEVRTTATSSLLMTLIGSEGARDFAVHLTNKGSPYGNVWSVRLPHIDVLPVKVNPGPVRVRIGRTGDVFLVTVNGETAGTLRAADVHDFSGMVLDFSDQAFQVTSLRIGPQPRVTPISD